MANEEFNIIIIYGFMTWQKLQLFHIGHGINP